LQCCLLARKARWRKRKQTLKANKDWFFIFFLAKELGTTVAQLSQSLTHEELIGWAAFFELKGEQEEQAANRARMGRGMTRG
jgi:hypothetical protein